VLQQGLIGAMVGHAIFQSYKLSFLNNAQSKGKFHNCKPPDVCLTFGLQRAGFQKAEKDEHVQLLTEQGVLR